MLQPFPRNTDMDGHKKIAPQTEHKCKGVHQCRICLNKYSIYRFSYLSALDINSLHIVIYGCKSNCSFPVPSVKACGVWRYRQTHS